MISHCCVNFSVRIPVRSNRLLLGEAWYGQNSSNTHWQTTFGAIDVSICVVLRISRFAAIVSRLGPVIKLVSLPLKCCFIQYSVLIVTPLGLILMSELSYQCRAYVNTELHWPRPLNQCIMRGVKCMFHDDVIKWKHFPRYWSFVRGIHRSPVNSLHKGQWRRALIFSLVCVWINAWVNNREAGDLRRHRTHYDVIVMSIYRSYRVSYRILWLDVLCVMD